MELSLCMIVKNEEGSLQACLESIRSAVDEIVIVDTGSADHTKEIALRYTDRVFDYVWTDDFAAARNVSLGYATKPFVLWLDADDVLDRSEREKLIALKTRLHDGVDAVMMPYHYAHHRDGTPSLVFERERIVRRAAGFVFSGVVHEAMSVRGNVIHEDIIVRHTGEHGAASSRRNLNIYEIWLARGRRMTTRDQYYYARELMACGETERAQQAFAAFLQLSDGWIENRLDALVQRGRCLCALGRVEEGRLSYAQALLDGMPRADALCALGDSLMDEEKWNEAAFWYRAAMQAERPAVGGGFVFGEYYSYIPALQLCVCYDRLGRTREAARMNELALVEHPDDEAALANRAYFQGKLENASAQEQNQSGK